jgi:hypothetical protein
MKNGNKLMAEFHTNTDKVTVEGCTKEYHKVQHDLLSTALRTTEFVCFYFSASTACEDDSTTEDSHLILNFFVPFLGPAEL